MNNRNNFPQNLHSNSYSGNVRGISRNLQNNDCSKNRDSVYLGNENKQNIGTKNSAFHTYKGMDGKIYLSAETLDIANRQYLESQNNK